MKAKHGLLRIFSGLLIVLVFFSANAEDNLDVDDIVNRAMRDFGIPGLSIAIVKDDKVVLTKGYGVQKSGASKLIDADTRFQIASNSKAFTATALALLVEEGKLEWDAEVINYLPSFQLSDPFVTREMTVRDLLVHRSGLGLGAGDLLWWPPSNYTRKEIVKRLRHVPLETSFRSHYAYDNVLYAVAAEVIEAVSGQNWEDFVEKRILKKIKMNNSRSRLSQSMKGNNIAIPHAEVEGKIIPVEPFERDATNAGAGISSTANDMAKWLKVQLAKGAITENDRLFSEDTSKQLWSIVTPIPISKPEPEFESMKQNFSGYALGFVVRDYQGKKLVRHNGLLPGFVSVLAMIPELNLGIVVLTNHESLGHNAIVSQILNHYTDAPDVDLVAAYKQYADRIAAETKEKNAKAADERVKDSSPSLPLSAYVKTYNDKWYGDILVREENKKLVIQFSHTPSLLGDLEHWQHDTFLVRWRARDLRADAFITFSLNPDGTIEHAKMQAASPDVDFSFDFHHLLLKPVAIKESKSE